MFDLPSGKLTKFANWNIAIFHFGQSTNEMGHGFKFANCDIISG